MVIGWAMERLDESIIPRDSLTLNTKVGRYESDQIKQFDFSYDTTLMSVQRSLTRMKCLYINVLQLHDPEFSPTLEILLEETIPAMLECRKRGYCKALGMTGYPLEVQHQILQAICTIPVLLPMLSSKATKVVLPTIARTGQLH
jgi:aryl-alcohol dehydrogenase-like predicted oxidoreductase